MTLIDQSGQEIPVSASMNQPIEIIIMRDPNLAVDSFTLQNVSLINNTNETFYFHFVNYSDSSSFDVSIHLELRPLNMGSGYWLIYRYDSAPQINSSTQIIDGWALLCPSSKNLLVHCIRLQIYFLDATAQGFYRYFIDNRQTSKHQSVIFGIREVSNAEFVDYCQNSTFLNKLPAIFNTSMNFSEDYEIRVYLSGCLYLDQQNNWRSDGLMVS